MSFVLYVKNFLGIASNDPFVLYVVCNLILCLIAILCFINIFIYFFVLYVLENNRYILGKMDKYL
jgi:Na+/melibiose symporter-like transporter